MKKRSKLWPIATLVAVLGGAGWAASSGAFGAEEIETIKGATVLRGPLRISVIERGNLVAADSTTLKSELEGRSTVLWLIEEGTMVEAGELVCELDIAQLEDRRVQQEISVQNAFATFTKAQQNYEIQVSQNLSDIARATQEVEFAEIDLAKYVQGERPQELQKADEDILLADEEMQRAQQDLEWSEKLALKGFLEQTQLDADRLAKTRSEVGLRRAERAKALLVEYEIPRREKELEANVEESRREKDRVELQAKARLADYDASLKTSEAKYDLEQSEFAKLVDQIGKAKIYAPTSGMVVYAVESRGHWGSGEPMKEGSEVRERQEIITIPSDKGYIAEASLHESVLEKVTTGMPCFVTVDALHTSLRAEVAFKAPLPDQQSWYANPDLRVYRTEIAILDNDPRMRPGMSCSIEILVEDLADVTHVPVQAVFLNAGAPIVLVTESGVVEKRPVELGSNNGKWVAIESGLTEGETVLLSRPPEISLEPASDDADLTDTVDWPAGVPRASEEDTAQHSADDQGGHGAGDHSAGSYQPGAEGRRARGAGGRPGGTAGGTGKR